VTRLLADRVDWKATPPVLVAAADCSCSSSIPVTAAAMVMEPLPESRCKSLLVPAMPCRLIAAPPLEAPVVAMETSAPATRVVRVMLLSKLMEPPAVSRESCRVTNPVPVWLKPRPATAPVLMACRLIGPSAAILTEPPATTWPLKVRNPLDELANRLPAMLELAAGGIDIVTAALPEARSLIDAGRARPLAVMAAGPSALYPDVPTLKSATGSNWTIGVWRGIAGPKGLPADVQARMAAALKKINASAEYKDFMAKRGFGVAYASSAEFGKFMANGDADMGRVLRDLGMAK